MDQLARGVIADAREVLRLDELAKSVLPRLEQATGADGALLYRYDADGEMELLDGSLLRVVKSYSKPILLGDPMMSAPHQLAPVPRVVLARRMVEPKIVERSFAYEAFYRPHRIDEPMCVWLANRPHASPGMTSILLTRSRGSFDAASVHRVRRALPDLVAAVKRSARFERIVRARDRLGQALAGSEGGPLILADRQGRVLWCSNAAAPLLGARDRLPPSLAQACASVLEDPQSVTVSEPGSPRTARLVPLAPGRQDTLIAIDLGASVSRPPASAPSPVSTPSTRRGAADLTPAEWQVLRWIGEGLSNPAIARRLGVSLETVRTHGKRLMRKIGAHSRVEAALWLERREWS